MGVGVCVVCMVFVVCGMNVCAHVCDIVCVMHMWCLCRVCVHVCILCSVR